MDPEIRKSEDDARAGKTPHIVRYVLGISVLLAVVLLGIMVLSR